MTGPPRRPVWRWYRGQGRAVEMRVRVRAVTCPLDAVVGFLPRHGSVLDWGCGHGVISLLAAAGAPALQVTGCEIDEAKIDSARAAATMAGVADRVSFDAVGPGDRPTGRWDGIVLCDVLYLQAPPEQAALVRAAAAALAPGGVLVCKELAAAPVWKRRLCRVQEQISVRLLRITRAGSGLSDFPDPGVVSGWLADEGLEVAVQAIDRGFHAPHVAVIGRRASDPESGDDRRGW